MIPSHRERSARADEAVSLLLVAGTTPHSGWQRLLPLFERAGCTLPESTLLEEWRASARGSAALGQSGVAMLHPGAHHQSLRAATATLLSACLSPALLAVDDMEVRAEFWLDELPGSSLLMLHCRPEAALVVAMNEERCLEEALAQWTSSAEAMVRIFRRHRTRVTLIDVECALAAPIDFLRHCNTSFGLNPLPYSAVATACDRAGSDIQHLIAAQMVAQSRETQDLIAELEACSLPIGEPATPPVIDCQALYARQRDEDEERRTVEKECAAYRTLAEEHLARLIVLERTRDEVTAKLENVEGRFVEEVAARQSTVEQLRQAQEALDAAIIERQVRSNESEKLQIKIDAQEEVRRELERENELLRQRSRQEQESYEALILELRNLSDGNEELLRVQETLRSEIQAMRLDRETKDLKISGLLKDRNEQSEKINRLERDLKRERQACHELMQESDLIIDQMHKAQELLEANHIQLEKAKNTLKDQGRVLCSIKSRLECAERKLQFRERRIRYLEESRSWRITAPLRNAARLLFGKGKSETHS